MDKIILTICMGSSCFARGNSTNVNAIQQYIHQNNLQNRIEIKGCLCEGLCKDGPHIRINDDLFSGVTPESIIDLLKRKIEEK